MHRQFLASIVLLMVTTTAFGGDFYDASVEKRDVVKNLVGDFSVSDDGSGDISNKLQQAIDELNNGGGGVLVIPAGTYKFANIDVKSNVHIEIDTGATLIPHVGARVKNTTLFSIGKDDEQVQNVSIRGVGGRFTAKFFKYEKGLQVVAIGNVKNFYIANFHCVDEKTSHSCVNFNATGLESGGAGMPEQGTVENLSVENADYGYGVIQAQAAKNVLFQNLSGTGGASLRFETGLAKMNDAQYGGLSNLVGKNISCTDGNCAVMISPHAMTNGVVQVDGIKSVGCGFGVRIEGGFVSKKYKTAGLKAGTFAKGSYVKNVEASYGDNAQLKQKHLKYLPNELDDKVNIPAGTSFATSFIGPSIAAVLNDANFEVVVENVTASGFLYSPNVVSEPVAGKKKAGKPGKNKKQPRNKKKTTAQNP